MRRIIREEEPPPPSTRITTLGQALSTISSNRDIEHSPQVPAAGLEQVHDLSRESAICESGAAESGAVSGKSSPESTFSEAELCEVSRKWPQLSASIKAGILTMVRGRSGTGDRQ